MTVWKVLYHLLEKATFWRFYQIFYEKCLIFPKIMMKKQLLKKFSLEDDYDTCRSEFVKIDFKPVWERYKHLFWNVEAKSRFLMSTFEIRHFLVLCFYKKPIFLQESISDVLTNMFFEFAITCATFEFFVSCQSDQYSLS